jgi:1,4-dihydroxy-2-naphthoyl-CoA synthase
MNCDHVEPVDPVTELTPETRQTSAPRIEFDRPEARNTLRPKPAELQRAFDQARMHDRSADLTARRGLSETSSS